MGQACKATRSSGDRYLREDIDAIVSSGAESTGRPLDTDKVGVGSHDDQPGPRGRDKYLGVVSRQ